MAAALARRGAAALQRSRYGHGTEGPGMKLKQLLTAGTLGAGTGRGCPFAVVARGLRAAEEAEAEAGLAGAERSCAPVPPGF